MSTATERIIRTLDKLKHYASREMDAFNNFAQGGLAIYTVR